MKKVYTISGAAIAHFRNEKDITQEELGKRLNLTRVTINNWENKASVSIESDIMEKLTKALGVNTDDLTSFQTPNSSGEYLNIHREIWEELKGNNRTYKDALDRLLITVEKTMDNLSKPANRNN